MPTALATQFGNGTASSRRGEPGDAAALPLRQETSGPDILTLTPQEIVCLEWCKEGKTNWEIGGILRISEKTVEFHLGNVMKKLGATNRITAVVLGLRYGLISL